MPIQVKCKCGNEFGAPSKYAGKKVKCPKCANPLMIPKSDGSAKALASAAVSSSTDKIAVNCKCGKSFRAKPELMGKTVRCPECKEPLKIAAVQKKKPTRVVSPPAAAAAVDDDVFTEIGFGSDGPGRKCPECKSDMAEEAILCINCGYNERLGRKMTVERPITQEDRENAYEEKTLTGGKKDKKKKR